MAGADGKLGGSGGMVPQEKFKFKPSEMAIKYDMHLKLPIVI